MAEFSEAQLLRYSRHIMLPEIDIAGQERLLAARVLVVGLGGLGSPVATYLTAAGVGRIVLADADRVELSNLQRQVLHATPGLNTLKTDSARQRLAALNPEVRIEVLAERLRGERLQAQVNLADVVIDATDNFRSRFDINRCCRQAGKPMVYGAAIRFEGQLSVFDPRDPECPCYRCLYGEEHEDRRETCETVGVLAPVLGVIGSLQAVECMKLIIGCGRTLAGKLLLYDALHTELRCIRLPRDPACPECGGKRPPG